MDRGAGGQTDLDEDSDSGPLWPCVLEGVTCVPLSTAGHGDKAQTAVDPEAEIRDAFHHAVLSVRDDDDVCPTFLPGQFLCA